MRDSPTPAAGHRWQLVVMLGALALVLLAAFPYFEKVRNANELPRLLQGISLVEQGEWAIDGPSRRGISVGPDVARSPVDGRLYPNKPPGASVVGALAYVIARIGAEPPTLRELTWWARLLAGVVPVLILAAVAWGRLRQIYGSWIAIAAIVAVVIGTPMFAYARLFYGHALAACLLFCGVVTIERGHAERRAWILALGGLLAALAIVVEYGAAFAGLPIAIMLVWPLFGPEPEPGHRREAAKLALAGLAGALVPVGLLAGYQAAVFGSPLATGYHHAANPTFAELHGRGLLGLGLPTWDNAVTHLLSPNTGLLVWSPLVVIAVAGLVLVARHPGPLRRVARLQLGIFAVVVVMGLGLSFQGGWRIGPRYLVVALPMLILGLAGFVDHFRDHPRAIAAGLVMGLLGMAAGWSVLANTLAATLWPHIDPTNISEPFGAVLFPLWEHGFGSYGIPSWFRGGLGMALIVPIGGTLLLLAWVSGRERPQLILLPMVLGIGLGFVALIIVIPRAVVASEKTERNLEYIERVYEPRIRAGERVPGTSERLLPLASK